MALVRVCCCVWAACVDDSNAGSSASLAQCCRCGGFFPNFAVFFALVLGTSVLASEFSRFRFYSLATLMV